MRSLFTLLFLLFMAPYFAANAQETGVITGRVVAEDGGGLANITVELSPVISGQPNLGRRISTVTGEDGSFKFTRVSPRAYSIGVRAPNGYVRRPLPASERNNHGYYRVGADVVITLIRGGVITGRVTTADGEPMVGAQISAIMTRDAEGAPLRRRFEARHRATDDRGVYRLYGLSPGTYIVAARAGVYSPQLSPYSDGAPTYYPSAPRDAAAEIVVTSGGEVYGVDIRYRGERGHIVSGAVVGGGELQPYGANVTLYSVATGDRVGEAYVRPGSNGFAIHGVGDGEYELVARRWGYNEEEGMVSQPRRISVSGADVGGVELKLEPQASIAGKAVVEQPSKVCEAGREASIEELVVLLRRHENAPERRSAYMNSVAGVALTGAGEFTFRHVDPGRYFIEPRLLVDNWYLKSIAAAASNTKTPAYAANIARDGVTLKAGEKLSGVIVTVADGAASLSGKVVPAKEGERLPPRVRVHLVPAEATGADDALRYAEAIADAGGSFALNNVAPGKYWLVARAAPDAEPGDGPVARDPDERAKLRRDAEAMKTEVELKPCQRATGQTVKFAR